MPAVFSASPDPMWPAPSWLPPRWAMSWGWPPRAASRGSVESCFAPPQPAAAASTAISAVLRAVVISALSHASRRVSNTAMQLFVSRHAVAEVGPGTDDTARALTDAGKTKLRQAVRGLRALDIRFERLLTSPWKRAVQTARQLAPIAVGEPQPTDLLTQPPRVELLALIAERSEPTAVVGHEPWLGELAAWLAFGDTRHGDALIIKKGGVLWLEGTAVPGGMQVRAAIPPRLLRSIR
jgi:phosphohistidine phosphatase